MNKQYTKQTEGDPIPLDESWWAVVLAEEEEGGHNPDKSPTASSPREEKPTPRQSSNKMTTADWQHAQVIYERDEMICMKVTGFNRGGLLVEGEGMQGFVPLSHLVALSNEQLDSEEDNEKTKTALAAYGGSLLRLKVIECEPERGRVVLSERAALAEPGRRNELLDSLIQGDIVSGTVTNITDFGVFVDLGGVEGLIHVSELSWGRVRHPSDVTEIGLDVDAFVISVDKERSRVALSLKRLNPNPWDTAEERYFSGLITEAVITSIVPFGAFARLEEGLDGLIHISEMSSGGERVSPHDLLSEGQNVKVRVIHVDASKQRLGLSLLLNTEG